MRAEGSVASGIQVFINTDRFNKDTRQNHTSASGKLPFPSNDLLMIAHEANRHLKRIFREGYAYKKVGVLLLGLAPEGLQQLPLFASSVRRKKNGKIEIKVKRQRLNEAIEEIASRLGKDAVTLGFTPRKKSNRHESPWQLRRERLSPQYTTRWEDLLLVS